VYREFLTERIRECRPLHMRDAVPAMAGQAIELLIRENLSGVIVDITYAPDFPAGDTFGGRRSVPSPITGYMEITGLGSIVYDASMRAAMD
jgi:hypothetical protein